MNPLVTKRAIAAAAVLTLLAVGLAVGLFITVRNYDRPSDEELVAVSETLQHFFRSYDVRWPEAHYADAALATTVTDAMQRDAQQQLAPTVAENALAAELANERVSELQRTRSNQGVIVTRAGHRITNVHYLRTTVEQTVIVRVDTIEWRQEAEWDSATDGISKSRRVEEPAVYDVSLREQPEGWRVVGMSPAE